MLDDPSMELSKVTRRRAEQAGLIRGLRFSSQKKPTAGQLRQATKSTPNFALFVANHLVRHRNRRQRRKYTRGTEPLPNGNHRVRTIELNPADHWTRAWEQFVREE